MENYSYDQDSGMSGTVVCDKTCLQCLTAIKSTTAYKRKTYEKTKQNGSPSDKREVKHENFF